jgi:formylmethanofuran dehydrogenase subunit E
MNEAALKHLTQADPILGEILAKVGPCTLVPDHARSPFQALVQAVGLAAAFILPAAGAWAEEDSPATVPKTSGTGTASPIVQSKPGNNAWNVGQPAEDWWAEIKREHGHVGPWNVLGWRLGQAALREFKSPWGRHELEIVCYVPLQTPFTCLVDGLSAGTGNSLGRLDLRLAEVFGCQQSFVSVRRKDLTGDVLEFRPQAAYLKAITDQPVEKLEELSRQCARKPEQELFTIRRISR